MGADLHHHLYPSGRRNRRHQRRRQDAGGCHPGINRDRPADGAHVHRPGRSRHTRGRGDPARCVELPDPAGLGHGLHADLQHDRAAHRTDDGDPGPDRLVRARYRVPLRSSARRDDLRLTQPADRTGVLRAARGDHFARWHRGGDRGAPQASETFYNEKAASKVKTPYGLEYSPHYHRTSRRQNEPASGVAPPGPPRTSSVLRWIPCRIRRTRLGETIHAPAEAGGNTRSAMEKPRGR